MCCLTALEGVYLSAEHLVWLPSSMLSAFSQATPKRDLDIPLAYHPPFGGNGGLLLFFDLVLFQHPFEGKKPHQTKSLFVALI